MPFYHRPPADRAPLRPVQAPAPAPSAPSAQAQWQARHVGYAVVDLETTGLSPTTDFILEIGLVLADCAGRVESSWSTLIDPGRGVDVGPTRIHGLMAEDLAGAPALDEVADLLVSQLAGRAVVAHNARFDVGFLTHALGLRGLLDRGARVPRVCTMEWSRHFMTTPSRRLTACCQAAGVSIDQHHSALDDALAAAGLLRHYLAVGARRGEEPAWSHAMEQAAVFSGWHWDPSRARAARPRLLARRRPGALRDPER
ncbi:3'-5' exonuclease [Actinomyces slackii]|uniref:DNA polymerase III polC-type n=1 Tax=Actinomyces slackii TaxID=52774 RepID=A0A3S4WJE8_9ACTO|nr:3'-5' exonuclease [Actinomyces slackii]VEG74222.1 DNA polymerase III polC-type [Actinomyces slackii]